MVEDKPNVWDVVMNDNEGEKTPSEIVGNWLCMGIAIGVVTLLIPFFLLCLYLIVRGNNAKILSPSIKPSLP